MNSMEEWDIIRNKAPKLGWHSIKAGLDYEIELRFILMALRVDEKTVICLDLCPGKELWSLMKIEQESGKRLGEGASLGSDWCEQLMWEAKKAWSRAIPVGELIKGRQNKHCRGSIGIQ